MVIRYEAALEYSVYLLSLLRYMVSPRRKCDRCEWLSGGACAYSNISPNWFDVCAVWRGVFSVVKWPVEVNARWITRKMYPASLYI